MARLGWFPLARIILVRLAQPNFHPASIDLNLCLKLPFTNHLLRPSKKQLPLILTVHPCHYHPGTTAVPLLRPPPLQLPDLRLHEKRMKVKFHSHHRHLLVSLQANPIVATDR
jgi:hypothetical protein